MLTSSWEDDIFCVDFDISVSRAAAWKGGGPQRILLARGGHAGQPQPPKRAALLWRRRGLPRGPLCRRHHDRIHARRLPLPIPHVRPLSSSFAALYCFPEAVNNCLSEVLLAGQSPFQIRCRSRKRRRCFFGCRSCSGFCWLCSSVLRWHPKLDGYCLLHHMGCPCIVSGLAKSQSYCSQTC